MSVRQSLLAILDQGPCYGYQLRAEFARRTGDTWPLNVGQIYNTLERLEREGLVARGEADERGHVYWSITPEGSTVVAAWFREPVIAAPPRDESAIRVALALTLPGVDALAAIRRQQEEVRERLAADPDPFAEGAPADAADLASAVIVGTRRAAAEAELAWLAAAEERLRAGAPAPLPLAKDQPRRGRPASRSADGGSASVPGAR